MIAWLVEMLWESGVHVMGSRTFHDMAAYWPTDQAQANDPAIASRMNTKPKLVFSTALEHANWSGSAIK